MLFVVWLPAEQAMKARKEIADYIKQRKVDRAKIRVSNETVLVLTTHVICLMT